MAGLFSPSGVAPKHVLSCRQASSKEWNSAILHLSQTYFTSSLLVGGFGALFVAAVPCDVPWLGVPRVGLGSLDVPEEGFEADIFDAATSFADR